MYINRLSLINVVCDKSIYDHYVVKKIILLLKLAHV